MAGGAVGAYLLASLDAEIIGPFVSIYLAAVGLYILFKAFRPVWPREVRDWIVPFVGIGGGALDAAGGGGWGPIVTGSLIGRGHMPRKVIGSTNLTEFLVTSVISATFIVAIGWSELSSAIGLIIGGVIAAPIGGYVVKHIPTRCKPRQTTNPVSLCTEDRKGHPLEEYRDDDCNASEANT